MVIKQPDKTMLLSGLNKKAISKNTIKAIVSGNDSKLNLV